MDAPPTYAETIGNKNKEGLTQSANDEPPAYSELFPGVREVRETVNRAREDRQSAAKLPVQLCNLICKSFFCGCCYVTFAVLPIVMIVIGSIYLHDCNIQGRIPIFLIVFGCVSLLQTMLGLAKLVLCRSDETENDDRKKKGGNFCESFLTTFLFIWIIVGSAYTFGAWPVWFQNGGQPCPGEACCAPVLMYFSFILLICIYGLAALCCCCFLCCVCCLVGIAATSDGE